MSDKKIYQLEVTYTTNCGTATHRFHVLAETKWEAIERAVTRYRELQPDRTYYKVLTGWSRETARLIQSLSAMALDYSMRYS